MQAIASFNVINSPDDIVDKFMRREKNTTKAVPEMVKAGGDVLAKRQQEVAKRMFTKSGKRLTGDTANSIRRTNVKNDTAGKYVEVFPHGKNRKGERNATVGFVQQYGRSNMPANPFMTVANEQAAGDVQETMREVWGKHQND